jgi:hypothetical protein
LSKVTVWPRNFSGGDHRVRPLPGAGGVLSGYKFEMAKTIEQWLLFKYIDGEFTPLSKPLKTKQLAEKARSKYLERGRKGLGSGWFGPIPINAGVILSSFVASPTSSGV